MGLVPRELNQTMLARTFGFQLGDFNTLGGKGHRGDTDGWSALDGRLRPRSGQG